MSVHADKSDTTEISTVLLTDDQKAHISKATGVVVHELSVLKISGVSARQLNPALLQGHAVVACW